MHIEKAAEVELIVANREKLIVDRSSYPCTTFLR